MVSLRKNWVFWRLAIFGVALSWFTFFAPARPLWASVSNTIPLNTIRSADCTGELVALSGDIHVVAYPQLNGSILVHFNYQGATGVGLTSGITYHTSAVDQLWLQAPFPSSINAMRTFRLISEGAPSNLLVKVLYHITVNANGEMTVLLDVLDMRCT